MKKQFLIISTFFLVSFLTFGTTVENYNKGKSLFEQKKYKEADVILKKLKDNDTANNEVAKLYAQNLSALGRVKDSYLVLEKLIIVNNQYVKTDKETYELQIKNIDALIKSKTVIDGAKLPELLDLHKDILADIVWQENPMDSDEIFAQGNEFFKQKKYAEALATFEKDRSGNIKNLFSAATIARFLKEYEKSIKYYNKVLAINPDFYEAYLGLSESYLKLNNSEKRAENLKIYLSYKPDERVYYALANIYYSSVYRDYKAVRVILLEGLEYFPESKALGDLLKETNKKLGIKEEKVVATTEGAIE